MLPRGLTGEVSPGDFQTPLEIFVPQISDYYVATEKGITLMRGGNLFHRDGMIAGAKTVIALKQNAGISRERKSTEGSDSGLQYNNTAKTGVKNLSNCAGPPLYCTYMELCALIYAVVICNLCDNYRLLWGNFDQCSDGQARSFGYCPTCRADVFPREVYK